MPPVTPLLASVRRWFEFSLAEGRPSPTTPQDTLLVGGSKGGERIAVLTDSYRLEMPVFEDDWWDDGSRPPLASRMETETYESRRFQPCFGAAPVRVWVLSGMDDETSIAYYLMAQEVEAQEARERAVEIPF